MSKTKELINAEPRKLALVKDVEGVKLIRKKVDWLRIIAPIKTKIIDHQDRLSMNAYIREICDYLKLNLEKESDTLYRDNKRHIAIHIFANRVAIEFEGQHFKTPANFEFALKFFQQLNSEMFHDSLHATSPSDTKKLKKLWHISRIDVTHDYLNATPDLFIPDCIREYKACFGVKYHPILNATTDILETVYLASSKFVIRSYRKDVEIYAKNGSKKGLYDLKSEEYKDKAISRFEIELADSELLKHTNDLFNLPPMPELTESVFVDSIMNTFLETKFIRKRNPNDSNESRWELHRGFESVKGLFKLEDLDSIESLKVTTDKNLLRRSLRAFVNRAEIENLCEEEIKVLVESEIRLRNNINKKAA